MTSQFKQLPSICTGGKLIKFLAELSAIAYQNYKSFSQGSPAFKTFEYVLIIHIHCSSFTVPRKSIPTRRLFRIIRVIGRIKSGSFKNNPASCPDKPPHSAAALRAGGNWFVRNILKTLKRKSALFTLILIRGHNFVPSNEKQYNIYFGISPFSDNFSSRDIFFPDNRLLGRPSQLAKNAV